MTPEFYERIGRTLFEMAYQTDMANSYTSKYTNCLEQVKNDLRFYMHGFEKTIPEKWQEAVEISARLADPQYVLFLGLKEKYELASQHRDYRKTPEPTLKSNLNSSSAGSSAMIKLTKAMEEEYSLPLDLKDMKEGKHRRRPNRTINLPTKEVAEKSSRRSSKKKSKEVIDVSLDQNDFLLDNGPIAYIERINKQEPKPRRTSKRRSGVYTLNMVNDEKYYDEDDEDSEVLCTGTNG